MNSLSRRDVLKGGAALAGAPLIGFSELFGYPRAQSDGDDLQTMFDLAATAETLACTLYYAVLTTGAIGFRDIDVVYLLAALDAELQHLEFLNANGGRALTEEFYFPKDVFTDVSVFVPTTVALETAFVGAYLAATRRAAELGNPLLAMTAAQVAAVEAQHLALVRVTGDLKPPNDVSLVNIPFFNVSDAVPPLTPFLEGGSGLVGPEPYLGADEVRAVVGEGGVTSVLPAVAPEAFEKPEG